MDCAIKPCTKDVHVLFEMNVPSTFWWSHIGGKDSIVHLNRPFHNEHENVIY